MKTSARKMLLSVMFIIVLAFGLLAASQYAYSQLKAPDLETQEKVDDLLAEKVMKDLRTPVNPEGHVCRAFTDYLDTSSEVDPSGTPEDVYERIVVLQEPVKKELDTVDDEEWKAPFNTYFDKHEEYMMETVEGSDSHISEMRGILEDISTACSTDRAVESVSKGETLPPTPGETESAEPDADSTE